MRQRRLQASRHAQRESCTETCRIAEVRVRGDRGLGRGKGIRRERRCEYLQSGRDRFAIEQQHQSARRLRRLPALDDLRRPLERFGLDWPVSSFQLGKPVVERRKMAQPEHMRAQRIIDRRGDTA